MGRGLDGTEECVDLRSGEDLGQIAGRLWFAAVGDVRLIDAVDFAKEEYAGTQRLLV